MTDMEARMRRLERIGGLLAFTEDEQKRVRALTGSIREELGIPMLSARQSAERKVINQLFEEELQEAQK